MKTCQNEYGYSLKGIEIFRLRADFQLRDCIKLVGLISNVHLHSQFINIKKDYLEKIKSGSSSKFIIRSNYDILYLYLIVDFNLNISDRFMLHPISMSVGYFLGLTDKERDKLILHAHILQYSIIKWTDTRNNIKFFETTVHFTSLTGITKIYLL